MILGGNRDVCDLTDLSVTNKFKTNILGFLFLFRRGFFGYV